MLMGLVVKNAILLVDNANQHRKMGFHLYDALVEAGKIRFRPIIMTTLAMIFGMLPMALNLHGGSGQNAPMAHAVIGGLISSTILTLVVVPVVLTYIESISSFFVRLFSRQSPHDLDELPAEL
jgi:HAE1 family hydrophobic/amphiphilic exporter-1